MPSQEKAAAMGLKLLWGHEKMFRACLNNFSYSLRIYRAFGCHKKIFFKIKEIELIYLREGKEIKSLSASTVGKDVFMKNAT